jgi:nitrogenase subunit NifH
LGESYLSFISIKGENIHKYLPEKQLFKIFRNIAVQVIQNKSLLRISHTGREKLSLVVNTCI